MEAPWRVPGVPGALSPDDLAAGAFVCSGSMEAWSSHATLLIEKKSMTIASSARLSAHPSVGAFSGTTAFSSTLGVAVVGIRSPVLKGFRKVRKDSPADRDATSANIDGRGGREGQGFLLVQTRISCVTWLPSHALRARALQVANLEDRTTAACATEGLVFPWPQDRPCRSRAPERPQR